MVLTRSKVKQLSRTTSHHPPTSRMVTRSQSKNNKRPNYMELEIDIDFDEASKAWNKNKIKLGNGCYQYKK
jgi:hypothetical protein